MKFLITSFLTSLTVLMAISGCQPSSEKASPNASAEEVILNNIFSRTSIRSYEKRPVEHEKIIKLLQAAMSAPSAMNKQPWHFFVVTDSTLLRNIARETPNASMAGHAPLAIVVCGNMEKEEAGANHDFWIQDVSAASQNILLAANSMGLGCVWTGTWPRQERCEKISRLLQLPPHLIPFNTIVIGYPAEKPIPKQKWNDDNVSWNEYNQKNS